LYNVGIVSAEADVRFVIDRRAKLGLDGPGSAAQDVDITLRLESDGDREQVARLVAHAERSCHAAESLAQGVPLHRRVVWNGEP
jgi:uncharacterized OsmC-like protein